MLQVLEDITWIELKDCAEHLLSPLSKVTIKRAGSQSHFFCHVLKAGSEV